MTDAPDETTPAPPKLSGKPKWLDLDQQIADAEFDDGTDSQYEY